MEFGEWHEGIIGGKREAWKGKVRDLVGLGFLVLALVPGDVLGELSEGEVVVGFRVPGEGGKVDVVEFPGGDALAQGGVEDDERGVAGANFSVWGQVGDAVVDLFELVHGVVPDGRINVAFGVKGGVIAFEPEPELIASVWVGVMGVKGTG
jgi:hypothetical protein